MDLINEQELRRIIRQMVQEEVQAEMQKQKPGVSLPESELTARGIKNILITGQSGFSTAVLKRGEEENKQRMLEDKKKESIDI